MAGNADDSQLLSEVNADLPDVYDLNDGSQELVIGGGNLVLQVVDDIPAERLSKNWKLNHLEAAIYLQEGENNDKFYTHPKGHEALPAYQIAHNKWFHLLDFAASICVLLLAACERPAVDLIKLPVGVHGSLEILMLLVLSLELAIRMKWLSWRVYFRHPRTVIKDSSSSPPVIATYI
ncbi:TPC1-like protein [Mya arenaria]|uniref:TPC1-like protein n=1 Tax=Mya arenaria TaxID=6604 RepID=A0ABY7DYN3_MYAAR|nr:TPC1-like protein [Mya arenaria]